MPLEAEPTTDVGKLVLATTVTTVRWIKPHRLGSFDRPATSLGVTALAQPEACLPAMRVLAFAMDLDTRWVVGPPIVLVLPQVLAVRGPPSTETLKAPLVRRHHPALTEIIALRISP